MYKKCVTDPAQHDENNFVYIVHGMISPDGKGLTSMDIEKKIRRFSNPGEFYRASLIGQLDAENAKEKVSWHGGGLSHTEFFGAAGLIVEPVLDELVCIAWNCYLGSPPEQEELKAYVAMHNRKRRWPSLLLMETKGPYNELIIRGDANTEIKGVVYREGLGEQEAERLCSIAEKAAGKTLPVIRLPKEVYETDDVQGKDAELRRGFSFMRTENERLEAQREFEEGNIRGGKWRFRSERHIPYKIRTDAEIENIAAMLKGEELFGIKEGGSR